MKMRHSEIQLVGRHGRLVPASIFVMPLLALFSAFGLGCQSDADTSSTDSTRAARPKSSIQICIQTPTLDVDQVLSQVTQPFESTFSKTFGAENVQSISEIEEATFWVQCEQGDEDDTIQVLAELLRNSELISDNMQVELTRIPRGPILLVAIYNTEPGTPDDLAIRQAAFVSQAISQLERIPHVAQVSCWSGSKIKLTVSLDLNALDRFGYSTEDVEDALAKNKSSLQKHVESMEDLTSLWRTVAAVQVGKNPQEEPAVNLKRLAQIDIDTVSVRDYPFQKMKDLPSHAFVLGIHIQNRRDAPACANAIQNWIEDLNAKGSVKATRNLGKSQPLESHFIDSTEGSVYPPNVVLSYEDASSLKSRFTTTDSDFEIRITGDSDLHQHQFVEEVDRKLQNVANLSNVHSIGLSTAATSKLIVNEEQFKTQGVKPEDVQKCIRKWSHQASSSRQWLGPMVELQLAPSNDALKRLQNSLRRLAGMGDRDTSSLIELEMRRQPVKVWRVGSRNVMGWIGRIEEPTDADELKTLISEFHRRLRSESNDMQIELRLNGRVFPVNE